MSEILLQKGILLKKIPYGESDEILTILLEKEGVQRFFASSSRKSKKRFSAGLDIFSHYQLSYQVNNHSLWRLLKTDSSDLEFMRSFRNRCESDLLAYAFFQTCSELISEFHPEALEASQAYDFWLDAAEIVSQQGFSLSLGLTTLRRLRIDFGYGEGSVWDEDSGQSQANFFLQFLGDFEKFLQKPLKTRSFLQGLLQEPSV